jgi:hypothetical protein
MLRALPVLGKAEAAGATYVSGRYWPITSGRPRTVSVVLPPCFWTDGRSLPLPPVKMLAFRSTSASRNCEPDTSHGRHENATASPAGHLFCPRR